MADKKLFSIEIPDAAALVKSLTDVNKQLSETQKQLKTMRSDGGAIAALKGDPNAGDKLIEFMDKNLDSVTELTKKLKLLKDVAKGGSGLLSADEIKALNANIVKTEREISGVVRQMETLNKQFDTDAADAYSRKLGNIKKVYDPEKMTAAQKEFAGSMKATGKNIDDLNKQYKALNDQIEQSVNPESGSSTINDDMFDAIGERIEIEKQLAALDEKYEQLSLAMSNVAPRVKFAPQADEFGNKPVSRLETVSNDVQGIASFTNSIGALLKNTKDANREIANLNQLIPTQVDKTKNLFDVLSAETMQFSDVIDEFSKNLQTASDLRSGLLSYADEIISFGDAAKAQAASLEILNGGAGVASKSLNALGNASTAMGTAIGTIAPAVGVAAVAVAGVQAVFAGIDAVMGTTAEEIQNRIDQIKASVAQARKIEDIISSGEATQVTARIEEIKKELVDIGRTGQGVNENLGGLTNGFDDFRRGVDRVTGIFTGREAGIYGEAASQVEELYGRINTLNEEMRALTDGTLLDAINRTKELNEIQSKANDEIEKLSGYQDELSKLRADAFEKDRAFQTDLIKLGKDAEEEKKALEDTRNNAETNRNVEHLATLETLGINHNRDVEDNETAHYKTLDDIQTSYQDDLRKSWDDYQTGLNKLFSDYQTEQAKLQDDYNSDEIDSKKEYEKTLINIQKEYDKEKIQRQKDLNEQLLSAELDNDALRFFTLQQDARKQEKEARKQLKESVTEEGESYEEGRKSRQEEFEKTKKERDAQYKDEVKQAQDQHVQSLALRYSQFTKDIALENKSLQDKQDAAQLAYDRELVDAKEAYDLRTEALRVQYAQEDAMAISQLGVKRKALQDSLDLELKYFSDREAILNTHLTGVEAIRNPTSSTKKSLENGELTFSEIQASINSVGAEIKRLSDVPADRRTEEENRYYSSLISIADVFQNKLLTSGGSSPDESISFNYDQIEAYKTALDRLEGSRVLAYSEENKYQLQYTDEQKRAAAQWADQIAVGVDAVGGIQKEVATLLQSLGLFTDSRETLTAQEQDSIKKLNDAAGGLGMTLDESVTAVDEANTQIAEGAQAGLDLQAAADAEARALSVEKWDANIDDTSSFFGNMAEVFGLGTTDVLGLLTDAEHQKYDLTSHANDEALALFNANIARVQSSQATAAQRELLADSVKNNTLLTMQTQFSSRTVSSFSTMTTAIGTIIDALLTKYNAPVSTQTSTTLQYDNASKLPLVMSAKGGVFDQPTNVVAGEEDRELIVPFSRTNGIPDDVAMQFGKGMMDSINNLQFTRIGSGSQQYASNGGSSISVSFGDISVGNGVTKEQVSRQLQEVGRVIIESVSDATSSGRFKRKG